jgi:hypothetical protein
MAMGKLSKRIYDLSDRLSLWWKSLTGYDPKQKALEMKQDYATPKRINTAIDTALGIDMKQIQAKDKSPRKEKK